MSQNPKNIFRKRIIRIISYLLLALILFILFLYYIRPTTPLYTTTEKIVLSTKIRDSVQQGKLQISFTEAELNGLLTKYMKTEVNDYTRILGAKFALIDQGIHATVHMQFFDKITAHVEVVYIVNWEEPYLHLEPQSLRLKAIPLATAWMKPIILPIELPLLDIVYLKDIVITTDRLTLQFGLRLPEWISK